MVPDLTGRLYALKLKNPASAALTTDVRLAMFRSSSTFLANKILNVCAPKGTTEIYWRPRWWKHRTGGTTGKEGTYLSTTDVGWAEMMEFGDEPLIVFVSSHVNKGGVSAELTAYVAE